ncbi:MAG: hypothetical protein ACTH5C_04555 [Pseudoalteromonas prydzensis]|uniref:hypothetical protein n=1 Tax=Pseudoalteromonas prydzensis TaxID=182141 RepID=UPI003F989FDC
MNLQFESNKAKTSILFALSILLAACGGGSDSSGNTTPSNGNGGDTTTSKPTINVTTTDCTDCEVSNKTEIMKITSNEAISAIDISYEAGYVQFGDIMINKTGESSFDLTKELTLTFNANSAGDYQITLNKVKIGDTWYEQNETVSVVMVEPIVNGTIDFQFSVLSGLALINTIAPKDVAKGEAAFNFYLESFEVDNYLYDEQTNTLNIVETLPVQADIEGKFTLTLKPGKYLSHFRGVRTIDEQPVEFETFLKYTVGNNSGGSIINSLKPKNVSSDFLTSQKAIYDNTPQGELMSINLLHLFSANGCQSWFQQSYNVVNINEKTSATYHSYCDIEITQSTSDLNLEYTKSSVPMNVTISAYNNKVGQLDFVNDNLQYNHSYKLGSNSLNFEFSEFAESGEIEFGFIDSKGVSSDYELTITVND